MSQGIYRRVKVAVINTSLERPYHSYGDHWRDGFTDAGCIVTVYPYDMIPQISQGFDLYFFVEIRYNHYIIPRNLHPRVLYSWDSHVAPVEMYEDALLTFDKIFLASKIDVEFFHKKNIKEFVWIPEACNPRIHKNLHRDRIYKLGFVGNNNDYYFRNGKSKDEFIAYFKREPFNMLCKQGIYGDDYTEVLNKIWIMFDRTIQHNIGTRIFESAASGCIPLWSDASYNTGINELLVNGKHYLSYNDTIGDAERVIKSLFNEPEKANKIAEDAESHVLANHTYANRALMILDALNIDYIKSENTEKMTVSFT